MKNILIIDDNEDIVEVLSTYLEKKGYNCTNCYDGKSGLYNIQKNDYDYVILDLSMPKLDGFEVVTHLEQKNKLKDTKIVVLTASSITEQQIQELKKKGIHSFLTKPCKMDELMQVFGK